MFLWKNSPDLLITNRIDANHLKGTNSLFFSRKRQNVFLGKNEMGLYLFAEHIRCLLRNGKEKQVKNRVSKDEAWEQQTAL